MKHSIAPKLSMIRDRFSATPLAAVHAMTAQACRGQLVLASLPLPVTATPPSPAVLCAYMLAAAAVAVRPCAMAKTFQPVTNTDWPVNHTCTVFIKMNGATSGFDGFEMCFAPKHLQPGCQGSQTKHVSNPAEEVKIPFD